MKCGFRTPKGSLAVNQEPIKLYEVFSVAWAPTMSGQPTGTTSWLPWDLQYGEFGTNGPESGWDFGSSQITATRILFAFLYLKLVAELRGRYLKKSHFTVYLNSSLLGMPIQSTTDCGSETTLLYGLASALRSVELVITPL